MKWILKKIPPILKKAFPSTQSNEQFRRIFRQIEYRNRVTAAETYISVDRMVEHRAQLATSEAKAYADGSTAALGTSLRAIGKAMARSTRRIETLELRIETLLNEINVCNQRLLDAEQKITQLSKEEGLKRDQ